MGRIFQKSSVIHVQYTDEAFDSLTVATTTVASSITWIRNHMFSFISKFVPPFVSTTSSKDKMHHAPANTAMFDNNTPLDNSFLDKISFIKTPSKSAMFDEIFKNVDILEGTYSVNQKRYVVKPGFYIHTTTLPDDYAYVYYILYLLAAFTMAAIALLFYFKREITKKQAREETDLYLWEQDQLEKERKSFEESEEKLSAIDIPDLSDPRVQMKRLYTDDIFPPDQPSTGQIHPPNYIIPTNDNMNENQIDKQEQQQQKISVNSNKQSTHYKKLPVVLEKVNTTTTIKNDQRMEEKKVEQVDDTPVQVNPIPKQEDQQAIIIIEDKIVIEPVEQKTNQIDTKTQHKPKLVHTLENRILSPTEEIQGHQKQIVKRKLDIEKIISKAEQEKRNEIVFLAKSLISLNNTRISLFERRWDTTLSLREQIIDEINRRAVNKTMTHQKQCFARKKSELAKLGSIKNEIEGFEAAFDKKQLIIKLASFFSERRIHHHEEKHSIDYPQNNAAKIAKNDII